MIKRIKLTNYGDTIIEVMLAMSLLTMILASAWSLTTRVTAISQASIKRTDMVNQLKAQAEMLISAQSAGKLSSFATSTLPFATSAPSSLFNECSQNLWADGASQPAGNSRHFQLDTSGNVTQASGADNVDNTSKLWVVAVQPTSTSGYVDFYIRGCWQVSGGHKVSNSQIFLRLNT